MQHTKNGSASEYNKNNKNLMQIACLVLLVLGARPRVRIALITLLVGISQSSRPYFSMIKILLGSVTLSWVAASSRLNT